MPVHVATSMSVHYTIYYTVLGKYLKGSIVCDLLVKYTNTHNSIIVFFLIFFFCFYLFPDGPMSIVMEFVPLGNLRDYLRSIAPSMFTFPAPYPAPHNRVILTNSGVSSSSSCSSGHPLLPVSIRALGHTPLSAQPSEASTHSYICYSSDVTTPSNQTTPTRELFSPNNSSASSSSQEVSPSHKRTSPYNINNKKSFPDIDFENYAFQIAKGLSHLQSMNVSIAISGIITLSIYLAIYLQYVQSISFVYQKCNKFHGSCILRIFLGWSLALLLL